MYGNNELIRTVAIHDHCLRGIIVMRELGEPPPTLTNQFIRNNIFQGNIYIIDRIDTLDCAIDENESQDNIYG